MATTVVRIDEAVHQKLKVWAKDEDLSIGAVIAEMAEEREQQLAYEKIRASYRRLQEDPEAWSDYLAEQRELQGMSGHNLRNEPPYDEPVPGGR